MERIKNNLTVWDYIRIIFGALFVFSGVLKLLDPGEFQSALVSFKLLKGLWLEISVFAIPIAEILLGILVIFKIKLLLSLKLTIIMLSLFTSVLITKIIEGEEISCGCFGPLETGNIGLTTIIRNLILITAGLLVLTRYQIKEKKDSIYNKVFLANTYKTTIYLLFFFLSILSIVLALQNYGLKQNMSLLLTQNETLQKGDTASPFYAFDLDSNKIHIAFKEDKLTALFIFSTICKPCKENLPNWILLNEMLKENDVRVFGIGLNVIREVEKFRLQNNPNFPVFSCNELEFKVNYKAFVTTQTLIIDSHGEVLFATAGVLNKLSISKI